MGGPLRGDYHMHQSESERVGRHQFYYKLYKMKLALYVL